MKDLNLLKSVLPFRQRLKFILTGSIAIRKKGRIYRVRHLARTLIIDKQQGKFRACLAVHDVPDYDRMLAEYLLIRSDEQRYLATARISYF